MGVFFKISKSKSVIHIFEKVNKTNNISASDF